MLRDAGLVALVAISLATAAWSPPTASAQTLMTTDAARGVVERNYGVEVLNIEPTEIDGRPAFLLRVMNPAGDYNEAFQVNTLAIDRMTGDLIPAFRNGPTGFVPDPSTSRAGSEDVGPAMRRGSLR